MSKSDKDTRDKFVILCQDGVNFLRRNKKKFGAVITSIPEMMEVGMDEKHYLPFFRRAANAAMESVKDDGYAIFYQTDRKHHGIIDKSYLITDEAMKLGYRMMFHKIALIKNVDMKDLYKPTYSHLLCYSKNGTPGAATPDVFHRGKSLYSHGAGIEAMKRSVEFLKSKDINIVVDPFVGRGTSLIVAKQLGIEYGIGIDIDEKQCSEAEKNLSKVK